MTLTGSTRPEREWGKREGEEERSFRWRVRRRGKTPEGGREEGREGRRNGSEYQERHTL
jgi:hypothetical protein